MTTIMNILSCCYSFDVISSQITYRLVVVEQEEEEEWRQSGQSCCYKDLEVVDVVAIEDVATIAVVDVAIVDATQVIFVLQMAIEDLKTEIGFEEQIQLGLIDLEFFIFRIVFVGGVWIRLVLLMDSLIDVRSNVQYV